MWLVGLPIIAALVWFIITPVTWTVNGHTVLLTLDYSGVIQKKHTPQDSIMALFKQFTDRGKIVNRSRNIQLTIADNPEYFSRKDLWAGTVTVKNIGKTPLTFNPFQEPRLVVLDQGMIVARKDEVKAADNRVGRKGVTLKPGESHQLKRHVMFKRAEDGDYVLFGVNERFKIPQPGKYQFFFVLNDAVSGTRTVHFDPNSNAEIYVDDKGGSDL